MNKYIASDIAMVFHTLARVASRNGGFWVSAGGGTANVVAGYISRATNIPYDEAHKVLDETGIIWGDTDYYNGDWYSGMYVVQPSIDEDESYRWSIHTIIKAAIRIVKQNRKWNFLDDIEPKQYNDSDIDQYLIGHSGTHKSMKKRL